MMMGFGFIWLVLLIGVFAYLAGWRPDFNSGRRPDDRPAKDPLEILKERYARGEITKEQYQDMRRDLEG